MAITILKLPVTPSPVSSFLSGVNSGQDIVNSYYDNKVAKEKSQYLPQQMQNAANLSMAKLKGQQIQNQFQPAFLQNRNAIAATNAQYTPLIDSGKTALLNAQQQNQLSHIPVNQQQLMNMQQQYALAPQKLAVQKQQSNAIQFKDYLQSLPAADKAVVAVNNAAKISQALEGALPQTVKPATPQENQQVKQLQTAGKLSANNDVTTAATRRQMEAGEQVKSIINSDNFSQGAAAAAEYAGAQGKGKQFLQSWTNTNQAKYVLGQSFIKTQLPLLAARIKTLEHSGATDEQNREINGALDYAYKSYSSNPARFMDSINNLKSILTTVEDSVAVSSNKIYANAGAASGGNINSNVKFSMPSFPNKQAYQSWYNSQTPAQQAQARAALGGH